MKLAAKTLTTAVAAALFLIISPTTNAAPGYGYSSNALAAFGNGVAGGGGAGPVVAAVDVALPSDAGAGAAVDAGPGAAAVEVAGPGNSTTVVDFGAPGPSTLASGLSTRGFKVGGPCLSF